MTQPQTELFSEVSKEQASQVNGGLSYYSPVMPTINLLLENMGSNRYSGTVGYPRYGGNPQAQFNLFDRRMQGILGVLGSAGISVWSPF